MLAVEMVRSLDDGSVHPTGLEVEHASFRVIDPQNGMLVHGDVRLAPPRDA
jgi:hypothetical protein